MELKQYYYKRNLRDTHCDYGIVADSLEECPVGIVKLIWCACLSKPCCKGSARFMCIASNKDSWIKCEETTKLMNKDPLIGHQETSVVEVIP